VKSMNSAEMLIKQLELAPHPEGGWFRETWRGPLGAADRASGTAIIFLLKSGEASHWHRVDADEMWLWQGGDPLELAIAASSNGPIETLTLGDAAMAGNQLQGLVPTGSWQAARGASTQSAKAGYSLVSCIVVPGFDFAGFEMAPPGWSPGKGSAA